MTKSRTVDSKLHSLLVSFVSNIVFPFNIIMQTDTALFWKTQGTVTNKHKEEDTNFRISVPKVCLYNIYSAKGCSLTLFKPVFICQRLMVYSLLNSNIFQSQELSGLWCSFLFILLFSQCYVVSPKSAAGLYAITNKHYM